MNSSNEIVSYPKNLTKRFKLMVTAHFGHFQRRNFQCQISVGLKYGKCTELTSYVFIFETHEAITIRAFDKVCVCVCIEVEKWGPQKHHIEFIRFFSEFFGKNATKLNESQYTFDGYVSSQMLYSASEQSSY